MSNVEMLRRPRGVKKGTPSPRKGTGNNHRAVLIRLPQDVIDHVDRAAQSQLRSRTAEILMRLHASMEGESFDEHGVMVVSRAAAAK